MGIASLRAATWPADQANRGMYGRQQDERSNSPRAAGAGAADAGGAGLPAPRPRGLDLK